MKKETLEKVKNAVKGVKAIQDTLTGSAREFADAIVGALEALEASDEEHDVDEIIAEVDRLRKDVEAAREEQTEEVANRVQKLRNEVASMINGGGERKNKLTRKVANEVARAIVRGGGKETIANEVSKVLTKNGISGLQSEAVVDYVIELKVEDLNPIWNLLHKTMYNKFYYGTAELTQATKIAHQWDKVNEDNVEKSIQQLSVTPKTINTDYIYKRQQVAFKDLDDIEEAGGLQDFLQFISQELYQILIDTVVMTIMVGDSVNEEGERITTFESIGTKTETDAFTRVVYNTDEDVLTFAAACGVDPTTDLKNAALAACRFAADSIWNPRSKRKIAIMNSRSLTSMAAYRYADGGDLIFRTRAEIAEQIGVDEIFTSDLIPFVTNSNEITEDTTIAIFLIPDGYHVKEAKSIDVAYPTYEKNVRNFQKEINAGGGLHDLLCSSILKVTATGE